MIVKVASFYSLIKPMHLARPAVKNPQLKGLILQLTQPQTVQIPPKTQIKIPAKLTKLLLLFSQFLLHRS